MRNPSISVYVGRLRPLIPELCKRLRAKGTTLSRELRDVLERLMEREGIELRGKGQTESVTPPDQDGEDAK